VHQEHDVLCKFFNLYKKKNQKEVEHWFHPKNLSRVCVCFSWCSTRLQFCSWRQAQTDNRIRHGEQCWVDRACHTDGADEKGGACEGILLAGQRKNVVHLGQSKMKARGCGVRRNGRMT
jgi:hypothetical protein